MTNIRPFQRRIAALTWLGAVGLFAEAALTVSWYGTVWQAGTGIALVVALAAVPAFRGNIFATRALIGGLACAGGASIVQLFWFIPGWPWVLPADVNGALLAATALATSGVLGYSFVTLFRRRRDLRDLATQATIA